MPVVGVGEEGADLVCVGVGKFFVGGDGGTDFVFRSIGGDVGELPEDFGEEVSRVVLLGSGRRRLVAGEWAVCRGEAEGRDGLELAGGSGFGLSVRSGCGSFGGRGGFGGRGSFGWSGRNETARDD